MPETATPKTPDTKPPEQHQLRMAVEMFYDLQKMRMSAKNRSRGEDEAAVLDDSDKAFLGKSSDGLHDLEKAALKHIGTLLKAHAIYPWLKAQKGVGPTMAGVIIASYDITRADTASKMWKYTGLCPGQRRQKGKKLDYNPWLKTKMVGVLADCMIKARSPWKDFYDNYKHRKASQIGPCMLCDSTGFYVGPTAKDKAFVGKLVEECFADTAEVAEGIVGKLREKHRCSNCDGTGRGPWGRSDAHRSQAAKRYMIKMFLLELHKVWRGLADLPVRPSYQEQYLGHAHAS